MEKPSISIPITEIPISKKVKLFIKREDLVHPEVSGNKYWKLFHNINHYLQSQPQNPLIITFGGAFSNHIYALSALGKDAKIPTIGVIRGEELKEKWQNNPTLSKSYNNGMQFQFVSREAYRNKEKLTLMLQETYPNALIVPEGGTNKLAVEGIRNMLNINTKDFDYLCISVGTGGSIAGVSKFCENHQKIIGFKVVNDDSLENTILELSNRKNFELVDASYGAYGKISDDVVSLMNRMKKEYNIPLEPIYTGKMMKKLLELIDEDYFPEKSKILCFHTGGLQGIEGANQLLKQQNRTIIE